MKQNILITGGAGFIGSHLVDKLINSPSETLHDIIVIDNFSSGSIQFINKHFNNKNFKFIEGDLLDFNLLKKVLKNIDFVYHLAANPEVRIGSVDTKTHFEQNIVATYNLLEAMRLNGIKNIAFTSTSTVYGEAKVIPTPEDYGPLIPISLYGASKLACEALITSYSHTFDIKSWIFRFANIVGSRSTHGIIIDFIHKLQKNPNKLEILGNGLQRKSYLLVDDCIDAFVYAVKNSKESVNILNIGSEDTITSTEIGKIVVEEMNLKDVEFTYTGGNRGWIGDVPKMSLSIEKIKKLGWKPKYNSEESIRNAIRSLMMNHASTFI
ncbi:MAG TPA: NAD-dependent epimerase/dehydratase family protein [Methanosarcinales archaeon]|nr:NAD-dependent epimerase/dehydratase family protein [Methanosarcinales archaeon]